MESSNPILVTEFNDELMAFFLALDRTTESWHRGSQGNDNGDIPVPLDADSEFLRHRELTFESRKKVLNLAPQVISTIIPPPEQSATQFVAVIVNNVDRAWHLCRFMHCIEAGDEPKAPEMIHVWNDMRTRLPALRNSLWEASRYIGTTLNLQPEPDNVAGDCVILRQMAAIVNRSKRTLERLRDAGKLPLPAVQGGKGRASEWRWTEVRTVLENEYARKLPKVFPSDQFRRD